MESRLNPEPCRRFPDHPRPLPPPSARPTCVVLFVLRGSSSPSTPPRSADLACWPVASFWSALSSSSSPLPRPPSSYPLASLGTHPCFPPGDLCVRARFAFPSSHHPGLIPPGLRLIPPYDSVCSVPYAPVHVTGATAALFPPVPPLTHPCAVTSYTRPALICAGFSVFSVPSGVPSALLPLCPPLPSLPLTALVTTLAASALPSP